ncbi:egl nine homolog 1-like isoform X5 [Neoarius graeffei]|uniref:egl nine homolog 1-like isoform X5 n=1 Tax=Neoarius graeffei TaxID=443677 RepID=UPI00298C8A93|nr:egl nine homolog 1-like isoform X5 [Neoarius graeffei]
MEGRTGADTEQDRQYCELCGKMENLMKCGRCRSSFYCSKDHQKQDWKKHKQVCKQAENNPRLPHTDSGQVCRNNQKKEPEPLQKEQKSKISEKSPRTCRAHVEPERSPAVKQPEGECDPEQAADVFNGQMMMSPQQKLATEYIGPCMNKHGICVVNNFLGDELGLGVLEEVHALYISGEFTDGQLVSQRSDSTKDIRGDKIIWIEGKEPGCEKIAVLMSRMDDIVRHCNGKLGNYRINGRTKILQWCRNPGVQKGTTPWSPRHFKDFIHALATAQQNQHQALITLQKEQEQWFKALMLAQQEDRQAFRQCPRPPPERTLPTSP